MRDIQDRFSQGIIFLLIFLAPIPNGSASPWSQGIILLGALVLFGIWAWRSAAEGAVEIINPAFWILILLFLGLAIFSLVPLPPGWLEVLSPKLYEIYPQIYPGYQAGMWLPLSVNSYATLEGITICLSLALLMFVVVHAKDSAGMAAAVILGILAAAGAEAILGLWQNVNPGMNIWSNVPSRISGTYINANHYAGLMTMAVPVGVGLACAAWGVGARKLRTDKSGAKSRGPETKTPLRLIIVMGVFALIAIMIWVAHQSLSRGGMTTIVIGGLVMAVIMIGKGYSWLAGPVIGVAAGVVALAHHYTGGKLLERFIRASGGEDYSLEFRASAIESGLKYIGDFPLLGSGLNTFRYVYEIYQTPDQKDLMVANLHNDWLQLFCETGIIGGLVFIMALALLFTCAIRAAWRQESNSRAMVTSGLLVAVFAMALFSFSDFNVSLLTANAMVMALALATAYKFSISQGGGVSLIADVSIWSWRLEPGRGRIFLAVCMVGILAVGARTMMAISDDICFNRYLARTDATGGPFRYFFIKKGESIFLDRYGNVADKGKTDELDGKSKDIQYPPSLWLDGDYRVPQARALVAVYKAARLKTEAALETGRRLFGEKEGAAEAARNFASKFVVALEGDRKSQHDQYLMDASQNASLSMERAPTLARLHILMADILYSHGADLPLAEQSLINSRILAPNSSDILLTAAIIRLGAKTNNMGKISGELDTLTDLHKVLRMSPYFKDHVYDMLFNAYRRKNIYFAVTPETFADYKYLYEKLLKEKEWEQAKKALINLDGIIRRQIGNEGTMAGGKKSPYEAWMEMYLLRNKAALLAKVEMSPDFTLIEAIRRIRPCLNLVNKKLLNELAELAKAGDRAGAQERLERYLAQIWDDPAVSLLAAKMAKMNAFLDAPRVSQINFLARLILGESEMTQDQMTEAKSMMDTYKSITEGEELTQGLLKARLLIRQGNYSEAETLLSGSSLIYRADQGQWDNRHLLWHAWGEALERMDRPGEAVLKYEKATAIAGYHYDSIDRLCAITGEMAWCARLKEMAPAVELPISFGGAVKLLGYTLRQAENDVTHQKLYLHWRLEREQGREYKIIIRKMGVNEKTLAQKVISLGGGGGRKRPLGLGEVVVENVMDISTDSERYFIRIVCNTPNPPDWYGKVLQTELGLGYLDLRIDQAR